MAIPGLPGGFLIYQGYPSISPRTPALRLFNALANPDDPEGRRLADKFAYLDQDSPLRPKIRRLGFATMFVPRGCGDLWCRGAGGAGGAAGYSCFLKIQGLPVVFFMVAWVPG